MEVLGLEGAFGAINRLETTAFCLVFLDIAGEAGGRRGELVAIVAVIVVAGEKIFLVGLELFGAVGLIEPDGTDGVGFVVDDAFGEVEVATRGVVDL